MKKYFSKMISILPVTFVYMPFIYVLFQQHIAIPYIAIIEYCYHTAFFYFGASVGYIWEIIFQKQSKLKHRLSIYFIFPYAIGIILAFVFRNTITVYNISLDIIDIYSVYPLQLFLTSMTACWAGIFYSIASTQHYIKRRNIFFLYDIFAITLVYYLISNPLSLYKDSGVIFSVYFVLFTVSFFIVRDFLRLNFQIDLYSTSGVFNASGTNKLYKYYFAMIITVAIIPIVLSFIILPHVINTILSVCKFALLYITAFILSLSDPEPNNLKQIELGSVSNDFITNPNRGNNSIEILVYYILLLVTVVLAILFRKQLLSIITWFIELFVGSAKEKSSSSNEVALYKETVTNISVIRKKDSPHKMTYSEYLRRLKQIPNLSDRYTFSYCYIFRTIVSDIHKLPKSITPDEMVSYIYDNDYIYKYEGIESLTLFYKNLKYGMVNEKEDRLIFMLNEANSFLTKNNYIKRSKV